MRVALLSWETKQSIAIGGVAVHVTELAWALARRGHDVHIFTRMGADQPRYSFDHGVHVHRCPFDLTPDFVAEIHNMCNSFVWHLGETEAFGGKFDIVHGHDWLTVPALAQCKNDRDSQVVLTMHSTEFGRCGNQLWDGPSRQVRDVEWLGGYLAERVICVSRALRDEIGWLYQVPHDKTRVIYNGVNVTTYDGPTNVERTRAKYGIEQKDPVVLFAGRMAWQKGPDLLLEAMPGLLNYYPQAKFVFAGDGHMRWNLEVEANRRGIHHATRFVGHRSGADLVDLFRAADLVCVPSRNEPFGIVILEAWSARKPVVATRNGGPAEFVEHESNGLSIFDNQDSVGWGVGTALASPDKLHSMGSQGRRDAEVRFSWDVIAGATEQVYAELLGGGALAGPDGTPVQQFLEHGLTHERRVESQTRFVADEPPAYNEPAGVEAELVAAV